VPRRLFHGGIAGLRVGDLIKPSPPHIVDGCVICAARARGETYVDPLLGVIDPPTGRPDRVYLTSDREYARWYAARSWRGALYVVDPIGELEPSTEDRFPTWCAPAARVRAVYDACVILTPAQRRSLNRRWTAADKAADTRARHLEVGAP
jgi:hypothetical protein